MAENTLLTRIQLKYDTLENWNSSAFILKRGEMAIAEVPSEASNSGLTPPAIGIKVGDGTRRFALLPWIQAVAGDVYDWAKVSTFQDIPGLSTYVANIAAQYGGGGGGGSSGTILQYRITKGTTASNDKDKYYLESSVDGTNWTRVSTLDFTASESKLSILDKWARGQSYSDNTLTPLAQQIGQAVMLNLASLVYSDTAVAHQFVTRVTQSGGQIAVERSTISAADITSGTLPVNRGGTGAATLASGEVLIGNGTSAVTTLAIDTTTTENSDNLITSGAVWAFVQERFGGLTGAMRMVGTATVPVYANSRTNPQISGYDFANAHSGDVILLKYVNSENVEATREFVWDASANSGQGGWILLGDEGSYAVKGSITNSDIASNAAIDQSKINNLTTDLNNKVDKEVGKGLSTNDFDNTYKGKVDGIETGAQVNTIEHIDLSITNDGTTTTVAQTIDASTKKATIAIDLSNVGQVAGAKVYDSSQLSGYSDISMDSTDKKLVMEKIAKTGDVEDLKQTSGTILVFQCGSSTVAIE